MKTENQIQERAMQISRVSRRPISSCLEQARHELQMREYYAKPNALLIVHQAYKIGQSQYGLSQWRIAFLCSTRGIVEIFRSIRNMSCEFEQAALVRAEIAKFRNN